MKLSDVELEERVRRLDGRVLRGVIYQGENAVYLELDRGRVEIAAEDVVGIGHGAGIALRDRKVIDPAFGPLIDASATPTWQPFIKTPIVRATLHWADVFDALRTSLATGVAIHADHLRRLDYPATLELGFAGGAVASSTHLQPTLAITRVPSRP